MTCQIEQCERPHYGRGWCAMHYKRWRAHGDPSFSKWDPSGRFRNKTAQDGECVVWTGYLMENGYAAFRSGGKPQLVHRYSYESNFGPIPEGMHVDHICHNRACVKPEHLRLATAKQNAENLIGATSRSSSGVRGVSWDSRRKVWRATVGHARRQISVGRFQSLAEAEAAVIAKRNELFTHNDTDRREA